MHKGSNFSTSSSTFVIFYFFYNTHSKWVWYLLVVCHTPLIISDLEHLFMCLIDHLSIWENICPSPLLIFNYLFCCWVVGIRLYSGYQSRIAVWYADVFSPFHGLTFHTLDSVLWCIVWGYRILKFFCFLLFFLCFIIAWCCRVRDACLSVDFDSYQSSLFAKFYVIWEGIFFYLSQTGVTDKEVLFYLI